MYRRVLLATVLLFACSDNKPKTPKPGLDGGLPGRPGSPDSDDDDELPMAHTECLTDEKLDLQSALKVRFPPAQGDATQEVPLTANGCTRLVRTLQGGELKSLSIRRYSGFVGFDPAIFDAGVPDFDNLELREIEYKYVELNRLADGSLDVVFNLDGADKIDGRLVESYAGDRIAKREFTRFNRSSGELVERRTLTSKDATTVHFKLERAKEGPLATVAEFDAPSWQRQNVACYSMPPASGSDTVACSEDFKRQVRERLQSAIERTVACFDKYENGWSLEQIRLFLFQQMYGDDLDIECFQSNEYVGEMDVGSRGPKLRINSEIFKCEQPEFVESTLFHEVMHHIRGPHDENDNELDSSRGPFGPRANAYTDPIRGCEALCFGTIKTACSCAACFDSDTCDSRCSSLPGCVARDPMGAITMSEAVGALCRDPANVPADKKKSTWHTTMMDCESNCAFGAKQCKSYSRSCDESCQ